MITKVEFTVDPNFHLVQEVDVITFDSVLHITYLMIYQKTLPKIHVVTESITCPFIINMRGIQQHHCLSKKWSLNVYFMTSLLK